MILWVRRWFVKNSYYALKTMSAKDLKVKRGFSDSDTT